MEKRMSVETFSYLLSNPNAIARQIRADDGPMAAFIVAVIELDGVGHITAIGVAPEYRRTGTRPNPPRTSSSRPSVNAGYQYHPPRGSGRKPPPPSHLYEELGYTVVQRLQILLQWKRRIYDGQVDLNSPPLVDLACRLFDPPLRGQGSPPTSMRPVRIIPG
jgi:hypothetical protein